MSEVTRILEQIDAGQVEAGEHLLPLVYDELRALAAVRLQNERPGQTLQPTALVHEAYVRLVDGPRSDAWSGRGHFFAAAAEAMRRILINRARDKGREKRGGGRRRMDLNEVVAVERAADEDLLALDEALERLTEQHQRCGQLVKLRFFAGLTQSEAAEALGVSERTAKRDWRFARAWLFDALRSEA